VDREKGQISDRGMRDSKDKMPVKKERDRACVRTVSKHVPEGRMMRLNKVDVCKSGIVNKSLTSSIHTYESLIWLLANTNKKLSVRPGHLSSQHLHLSSAICLYLAQS